MRGVFVAMLALVAQQASAAPAPAEAAIAPRPFKCGAKLPQPEVLNQMRQFYELDKAARNGSSLVEERARTSILVDTYFHIVQSNAKKGSVTSRQMNSQLNTLNGAYANLGIKFRLRGTDTTTNDVWAKSTSTQAMYNKLHKGGYDTLNIYFHTDLGDSELGTCTLPSPSPGAPGSPTYLSDGCSVAAQSVPGGSIFGYNQGKTAAHEAGHWFGLLHTFEGNACSGNGDLIADTPLQKTSTVGCPANKNSCPSSSGNDAIHNYMDYSQDSWYASSLSLLSRLLHHYHHLIQ
ncbi:MAG: hypothetical protein M1837_004640 [Sclerophora amabilis]|nr:MAG: hypothetical protein M1837_004640 [Sclerophora amabilis]